MKIGRLTEENEALKREVHQERSVFLLNFLFHQFFLLPSSTLEEILLQVKISEETSENRCLKLNYQRIGNLT